MSVVVSVSSSVGESSLAWRSIVDDSKDVGDRSACMVQRGIIVGEKHSRVSRKSAIHATIPSIINPADGNLDEEDFVLTSKRWIIPILSYQPCACSTNA